MKIRVKKTFGSIPIKVLNVLFITSVLVNFKGCCFYSFTGASVPEHLKTVAIPVADDRSGSGEYGLRELFTNELTQKFVEDNNLKIADRTTANSILECIISSYTDSPAIVSAGETVQTRRINISVSVVFRDLVKRKVMYERTFSNYGEYPSGGTNEERRSAIEKAINLITDDILLDTVSGW